MNINKPLHTLSSGGEGADSQVSLESVRLTCSEQLENDFYDIKEISSVEEEQDDVLRQEEDSKKLIELIDRIPNPNPEKEIVVNE